MKKKQTCDLKMKTEVFQKFIKNFPQIFSTRIEYKCKIHIHIHMYRCDNTNLKIIRVDHLVIWIERRQEDTSSTGSTDSFVSICTHNKLWMRPLQIRFSRSNRVLNAFSSQWKTSINYQLLSHVTMFRFVREKFQSSRTTSGFLTFFFFIYIHIFIFWDVRSYNWMTNAHAVMTVINYGLGWRMSPLAGCTVANAPRKTMRRFINANMYEQIKIKLEKNKKKMNIKYKYK